MKIRPVALFETQVDPWGFSIPIMEAFKKIGYPCDYLTPASESNLDQYVTILLYGPMRSITTTVERFQRELHSNKVVMWFTEQVPPPHLPKIMHYWVARYRYHLQRMAEVEKQAHPSMLDQAFIPLLRRAGRLRALGEMIILQRRQLLASLCVFTEQHARFFRACHIPASVIPMGYHPLFGRNLHLDKDIDILFIGSLVDRRREQTIAKLQQAFAQRGLRFVIYDGSRQRGAIYGKCRMEILNRAHIFLNIFRQPWDDPTFRLLLAGANHTMLLSETVWPNSTGPFTANLHFAESDLQTLAERTLDYLAHPAEMEAITEANAEFIRHELTMENQAAKIIAGLQAIQPRGSRL